MVDGKLLSEKDIFLPEDCLSTSYLVMASIDLKQPEKFQDTKAVVTGAELFYVSEKKYLCDRQQLSGLGRSRNAERQYEGQQDFLSGWKNEIRGIRKC